jgi:outer membrane lipoprotein-sorting protein
MVKYYPLPLFVIVAGASCLSASAADEKPAIAAFDRTFAGVNDYTCVLHSHEVSGEREQDRVYQYEFMKPHYLKTLVLSGDGKGSGGVWVGGNQVSGHLGGILSGIHVRLGLDDPRVLSLHGVTIPDGLLPGIIDDYATIPGTLTQSDGGMVKGIETDRLDLKVADPSTNHGITEQIAYFSKSTHWPIRQIMYSGSEIVLDESVSDLEVNVGLTKSDFSF